MRAPAWARNGQPDFVETANEKMRSDVARDRLHLRGVGHLPLDPSAAARELQEGERALRSSRPRNRRWRALEKFEREIDRLTQRQAEASARVQEAEATLASAPDDDARTLAKWLAGGEKGERPAATMYERVVDIGLSDRAVNDDPGCPAKACVNFLQFPQWGEPYGLAGESISRFYFSDVRYGGQRHLFVAVIEAPGRAQLDKFLVPAKKLIATVRVPASQG